MFNKTSIAKKTRLIYKSSKKFRKTLIINRKIKLKNSLENSSKNDYSLENNSNIYIKTSAQSKLGSESNSICPIQTSRNYKRKKSFVFDEKDMDINKNKKIDSSYFHQSEKKSNRLSFNKILNLKRNSFFFGKNNRNKDEENINNMKNEIIQVNVHNQKYAKDYLNIMEKDKLINKLAKKLKLKLNEDEYYKRNKTLSDLGANNIIFKNGFFNGTNIVMNIEGNEKKDNKSTNNKIDNKYFNQNIYNDNSIDNNNINLFTQKKSYTRPATNLPLYLRDKENIQGTDILSPFCKEARDEFLFKKIFNSGLRRKLPKKLELINNKFNIFYAENETQYVTKLKKHNDKLKLKGNKNFHVIGPTKDQIKLNRIITTISFIKKIFDYSYPNMILTKVRKSRMFSDKRNLTEIKMPPYKKTQLLKQRHNEILEQYLKMSIDVKNIK